MRQAREYLQLIPSDVVEERSKNGEKIVERIVFSGPNTADIDRLVPHLFNPNTSLHLLKRPLHSERLHNGSVATLHPSHYIDPDERAMENPFFDGDFIDAHTREVAGNVISEAINWGYSGMNIGVSSQAPNLES